MTKETPSTVKVLKVTSILVVEDEELLYHTAKWTLSQLPNQGHGYKLLDDDGTIDVVECTMVLHNQQLPAGLSGPTDSFEMKELLRDQVPGRDLIKAFEESGS